MSLIARAFRVLFRLGGGVASKLRIARLCVLYPGFSADRSTFISPGCDVTCSNGSTIRLNGTHVHRGVRLQADEGGTIEIAHSSVGRFSVIVAVDHVAIGPGVSIAEMVTIRDQNHVIRPGNPAAPGDFHSAAIAIHRNAWLGAKSSVLAGVTVGESAVLAASAVATAPVDAFQVYAGVPARRIKDVKA